jgi:hypothetical protein
VGVVEDLRELVKAMRELGVISAHGVVLGPAPSTAATLTESARTSTDPGVRKALEAEAKRARAQERLEEHRAEVRTSLAATGIEYSDAECDYLQPPPSDVLQDL